MSCELCAVDARVGERREDDNCACVSSVRCRYLDDGEVEGNVNDFVRLRGFLSLKRWEKGVPGGVSRVNGTRAYSAFLVFTRSFESVPITLTQDGGNNRIPQSRCIYGHRIHTYQLQEMCYKCEGDSSQFEVDFSRSSGIIW